MISDDAIKCLAELHQGDFVEFARCIESATRAEALEDVRREFIKAITWQDLGDFIASELMRAK